MNTQKTLSLLLGMLLFVGLGSAINDITISPSDGTKEHHDQDITVDVGVQTDQDTVLELYVDGSLVDTRYPLTGASSTESYTINTFSSDAGNDITFDAVLYERGGDNTVFDDPSPLTYTVQSDADVTSLNNINPNDGATLTQNTVTYEYGISGKSGTIDITSDTCSASGVDVHTDNLNSDQSTTFTYDRTFQCSGTFNWQVQYTGDDGSFTNTPLYTFTIESDANALDTFNLNNPNDFDDINADIDQEKSVDLEANINSPEPGTVEFYIDGANVGSDGSFTTGALDLATHSETLSDGSYDFYAEYTGSDGSTEQTSEISFDIEDFADRASLSLDSPTDNSELSSNDVTFNYGNSAGGDGDVKLYVDGVERKSDSYFSGDDETYSHTVNGLSSGSHSWYVEYVGDDGSSTQTSQDSFDIQSSADRSSLSISSPSDGDLITSDPVTFEYGNSAGGNGDVSLYVDGNQQATDPYSSGSDESYSSPVSGLSAGSHSFYVQYDGDDGSTTQTSTRSFTVGEKPSIVSVSVLNLNPQIGDPVDIALSFSDDSQLSSYDITVDDPSGSQIASSTGSISGTSATPQENSLFTPSTDGTYTLSVTVTDADGLSSSTSKSVSVSSEPAPTFNLDQPVNNAQFQTALGQSTASIDFTGNINADFSGTTALLVDGTQVDSQSLASGGDSYNLTSSVSRGSHAYTIEASSSASGSTYTSSTRNFDVVDQDQSAPVSSDNWSVSGSQDQRNATVRILAVDNDGVGVSNLSYRKNSGSFQTVQDNDTTITFTTEQNNTLQYFAVDNNGNNESINTEYVAFEKENSLSASVTTNVSNPKTGESVEFDASGSSDSGGSITGYSWDLDGDGVFGDATGPTVVQSYADNGSETVSVNVSSTSGFTEVVSETVNVQNRLPNASFTFSTDNLELSVNASASSDPDGSISSYDWDWTNDLNNEDSGETATHNYSSDGNYNVKLTVTDNDGDIGTEIKTVSVSSPSSGGSGGSGGGGGGSDTVDTTTVYFNSEGNVEESYTVPFDETVERDLVITNTQRQNILVTVDRGSNRVCDLIEIQSSFGDTGFGEGAGYDLPEATENFGTLEASNTTSLRIDAPSKSVVEERGLDEMVCRFDTSASYGQAEDLKVVLEFNDSFFNQLLNLLESTVFEIPVGNLSSGDPEVENRIPVQLWMLLAALLAVFNLYLLRN